MLCPTCPKKSFCQSPCDLLEAELAKVEVPMAETLLTSAKLHRISGQAIVVEYLRASFSDGEEIEDSDQEQRLEALKESLSEAFELLTPQQLKCVQLSYWENLSQKQIAEQLKISRPAVTQHLSAAHTILKKYLTGTIHEDSAA